VIPQNEPAKGTRRQRERQEDIWVAHTEIASAPSHPFYQRLSELLEAEKFDEFVEARCAKFYAAKIKPPFMPLAVVHASTARFIHAGTGTVRTCFAFPIKSTITQWSSRIWKSSSSRLYTCLGVNRPVVSSY
jgi:hypothetical protein